MKRFLQFLVILAMLVSIFPMVASPTTVKAADGVPPEVVCVPWKGDESLPHPTWDGKEITLKGTVRYDGDIAYEWNFGDGSSVENGTATVGNDYPYPVSAKHIYNGLPNSEYVATLKVIAGAVTDSDSYMVKILPQTLEVEADVAIDEGLWWLYQTQYRYTSDGVDLGSWGGWARVADTGAAVQAFENNLHKPFGETNKDPYVDCVSRGLNFLLSMALPVTIPPEDPYGGDTNGNGIGIACWDWQNGGREMYEVGIAMMAIVSSDTPARVAVTGPVGVIGRTYRDIVQDMADYCAWAQNDAVEVTTVPGIYVYDLSSSTQSRISEGNKVYPAISGDKVVWMDYRNGNSDIYMYDLSTGNETPVCVNSANQDYPAISGDKIVWMDTRSGNWDIYMYDLSAGNETPICVAPGTQEWPAISGDIVVWMDYRNGKIDPDIYAYGISTSTEMPICIDPAFTYYPDVSSEAVVWVVPPWFYEDPNRVGGWRYSPNYYDSDNSVTQWPIMGLDTAEAKWCIDIADFVRERLEGWLTYSQCKSPDSNFGGYGYTDPCGWVNVAKTAGTGIPGLLFCGAPVDDERIQNAVQYVDNNWAYDNFGNGYAMYAVKKAFDEFLPMESTGTHTWWDEYVDYIVPLQYLDGHWDAMGWTSGPIGTTAWMILILTPGVYDVPPTAVAKVDGFDSIEIDKNQSVTFDGSQSRNGSYEIVKYEWDFESDGVYDAVGVTATHSYSEYGTYTITLRITDNRDVVICGEKASMTDTDTCTVWVHEPPHAPIADANGPYLGWPGAPVPLNGCGSWDPNPLDSIVVYAWDLDNDGVFETTTGTCTLEHTWTAEGTYSIALMVQDNSGGQVWSKEPSRTIVEIIGNHNPVADANGPYEAWTNQTISLDGCGSYDPDEPKGDRIVSYEWDLDNDGWYDDAFGCNPEFHSDTAGTYTVRLKVTDTPGATDTDWTTVTVAVSANTPPVANANGPYVGNEGSPIAFNGSASYDPNDSIVSWEWDLDGDGAYDDASGQIVTKIWGDDYSGNIGLRVTDSFGATDTDSTSVTVRNVAPSPSIDSIVQPNPYFILPGQMLRFNGSFTDPGWLDTHTARWDFGDGTIVPGNTTEENEPPDATGTTTAVHAYLAPGTYTVTLTVTDDNGGVGTASTAIPVRVLTAEEGKHVILNYIQKLPASAFDGPADQRKNALANQFAAVDNMIRVKNYKGAIQKLQIEIRAKADGSVGGNPNNDWITDPKAQKDICAMIDALIAYLNTL